MRRVRGPVVAICLCAAISAPALFGQSNRLNPTVKVLPKPTSIVPTDCDEGLAPAVPRAMPATTLTEETAAPLAPSAPPAADLRTRLRRVQSAAENGDYQSFKNALGEARAAMATYPAGGEKQAASDVLQVYTDLEKLWDFAMTSPTGAFFDDTSENGSLVSVLRKYPEFPKAVADATMTIGGTTVYPSTETRRILVNEAARRLARLGVRTPSRVVEERPKPRVQPQPAPQRKPRVVEKQTRPKPVAPKHEQAAAPRPKPAVKKPATKIAEATPPKPAVRHEVAKPQPQPKVVTPAPQPQPQPKIVTPPATSGGGQPPPLVPAPTMTATSATTATTDTAAGPLSSTASDTTATATTGAEKPAQTGGMNFTFAIILIVIGIGVLIVLFRAQD